MKRMPDDGVSIFVFGSNEKGLHGGGAAKVAHNDYGAIWGHGEGLYGRSYALPTCQWPGVPLDIGVVGHYVRRFIDHAKRNPQLSFWVTKVGCGLAGFKEEEVIPFFKDVPENVILPEDWGGSGFDF